MMDRISPMLRDQNCVENTEYIQDKPTPESLQNERFNCSIVPCMIYIGLFNNPLPVMS